MAKEYNQKACNLKDVADTLNDIINEFPEDTKLDTKIIPFENMNMVVILYREAEESGEGGGDEGDESTGAILVYFEGTKTTSGTKTIVTPTSKWNYTKQQIIDMVFTQKQTVTFGAYLTDGSCVQFCPMYQMAVTDNINNSMGLGFLNNNPDANAYSVGTDGTVTVEN